MPSKLLSKIGNLFNKSRSEFLICYHKPSLMISTYKFDVELLAQTPTTMSGSGEAHECYVYRRPHKLNSSGFPTLPLTRNCRIAVDNCKLDLEALQQQVKKEVDKFWTQNRLTRSGAASIFSLQMVLMDLEQSKKMPLPQGVDRLIESFLLGDKA